VLSARAPAVTYVAAGTAYLDAGTADGLVRGARVELSRRSRNVGACDVVEVSAHHAACTFAGAEVGDQLRFSPERGHAVATLARAPREKPRRDDDAVRERLAAATADKVVYRGSHGLDHVSARAGVSLRHQSFVVVGDPRPGFQRTTLDGRARTGLGLPGLFAEMAFRVRGDLSAPPDQRALPGELVEISVLDAHLGLLPTSVPVAASLGRFRTRKAPGVGILDGAQAGFVGMGGALEVGAYGGAVPALATLAPSADVIAGGLYAGVDLEPWADLLVLPRARVGVLAPTSLGVPRIEGEADAQILWSTAVAVGLSARAALRGDTGEVQLDAGRADVDVKVMKGARVSGSYRYEATPSLDFDALSPAITSIQEAHRGALLTDWRLTDDVTVGALGTAAWLSGSTRTSVGPTLGLPHLFGEIGGVHLLYTEDLGAFGGRYFQVAAFASLLPMVRFDARTTYAETFATDDSVREGLFALRAEAPIAPWLAVWSEAQATATLPHLAGVPRQTPILVIADIGIRATVP